MMFRTACCEYGVSKTAVKKMKNKDNFDETIETPSDSMHESVKRHQKSELTSDISVDLIH